MVVSVSSLYGALKQFCTRDGATIGSLRHLGLQIVVGNWYLQYYKFLVTVSNLNGAEEHFCTGDDATVGSLKQYFKSTNRNILCNFRIYQFQFQI